MITNKDTNMMIDLLVTAYGDKSFPVDDPKKLAKVMNLWSVMFQDDEPKEVLLAPLLVAAGEHAIRDMAGDSPKSWKNQIEKEGPSVIPILRGMGEYETVRALYVRHAKQAEERGLRL